MTYHRGRDRANEVDAELSDDHAATTPVALEFAQGDWRSHQRLLAALPGPVDVLVNNAAVIAHGGDETRAFAEQQERYVRSLQRPRHPLGAAVERMMRR